MPPALNDTSSTREAPSWNHKRSGLARKGTGSSCGWLWHFPWSSREQGCRRVESSGGPRVPGLAARTKMAAPDHR